MVICLMPLPLTVSCFRKIQIGLPFWDWLTRVVPEKGPLSGWVCVCEVQIVCIWWSWCHCIPRTPLSLASFKSDFSPCDITMELTSVIIIIKQRLTHLVSVIRTTNRRHVNPKCRSYEQKGRLMPGTRINQLNKKSLQRTSIITYPRR